MKAPTAISSPAEDRAYREAFDKILATVRMLHDRGVFIVFGTDTEEAGPRTIRAGTLSARGIIQPRSLNERRSSPPVISARISNWAPLRKASWQTSFSSLAIRQKI